MFHVFSDGLFIRRSPSAFLPPVIPQVNFTEPTPDCGCYLSRLTASTIRQSQEGETYRAKNQDVKADPKGFDQCPLFHVVFLIVLGVPMGEKLPHLQQYRWTCWYLLGRKSKPVANPVFLMGFWCLPQLAEERVQSGPLITLWPIGTKERPRVTSPASTVIEEQKLAFGFLCKHPTLKSI